MSQIFKDKNVELYAEVGGLHVGSVSADVTLTEDDSVPGGYHRTAVIGGKETEIDVFAGEYAANVPSPAKK